MTLRSDRRARIRSGTNDAPALSRQKSAFICHQFALRDKVRKQSTYKRPAQRVQLPDVNRFDEFFFHGQVLHVQRWALHHRTTMPLAPIRPPRSAQARPGAQPEALVSPGATQGDAGQSTASALVEA